MDFCGESPHVPALSCPNLLHHDPALALVPLFPNSPLRSPQDLKFQVLQAKPPCLLFQLSLQLLRVTYWLTCNLSGFNWGAPRESISARLRATRRAHQPHGQPSAPILGRCIWEWDWCARSAAKPFSIQTSSGITRKLISENSL